jgi:hypothetical protein
VARKAKQYRIWFLDGTEATYARRPVHDMRAERMYGADAGANEIMLATFWACATGGTGSRDEFEAWAETVEEWESVAASEEDEAVPLDPPGDGSPEQP